VAEVLEHAQTIVIGNADPEFREVPRRLRGTQTIVDLVRVSEAAKQCGIVEQTYYRWRREYGGMDKSEVRRLKELEQENARLKKLVAELCLDKAILEEAVSKK
jgi:transposase-like protein